ncbi:MAG: aldehyde ferredoxin oxidoreductase family protein [Isosphaeraceae bacterium]
MFGVFGRYLRVDATRGTLDRVAIDEGVLRQFLGGVGLGAWLLARETPAGVDPLGPDAALAFVFSPLVGSPLTTSAKFAVVGFSPLTGRVCDALSSSRFALAGKRVGVDAIVIVGRREAPSVAFVDGLERSDEDVRFEPAGELWSRSGREAEEALRGRHGADWQIAAIGPAGERLIPFASISHDGRHAGRGGLGAVLGSKNLKALAVRGDRRAAIADPERTVAIAKELSAKSFGPATEKYRELGTVANLLVFNRFDALPTRNFQGGRFEGVERLATTDLGPARKVARNSCAACAIGCEHVYALDKNEVAGSAGVRLEYESLFALGPLCGVDDPSAVLRASKACDDLGLDTISTGGTIAFLMECAERGWIDGRLPVTGRPLRFGDGAAVLEAIAALAERQGDLGATLALGSRAAAERLGGQAPSLAPHVKGLELPGYHPGRLHAMALGLAVGTRGADHNRSGAYEADFSDRIAPDASPLAVARAAIETEDRAALIDSLILCKFLRGVFIDMYEESAEMLRAVTGWDVSAEELRTVARRVVTARKLLNSREGWTAAEDTLPDRFLAEEVSPAPTGRPLLTRARLDSLIAAYYRERDWSGEGAVPKAARAALNLDFPPFGA